MGKNDLSGGIRPRQVKRYGFESCQKKWTFFGGYHRFGRISIKFSSSTLGLSFIFSPISLISNSGHAKYYQQFIKSLQVQKLTDVRYESTSFLRAQQQDRVWSRCFQWKSNKPLLLFSYRISREEQRLFVSTNTLKMKQSILERLNLTWIVLPFWTSDSVFKNLRKVTSLSQDPVAEKLFIISLETSILQSWWS